MDEPGQGVGHVAPVDSELGHARAPPALGGLEEGFYGQGRTGTDDVAVGMR